MLPPVSSPVHGNSLGNRRKFLRDLSGEPKGSPLTTEALLEELVHRYVASRRWGPDGASDEGTNSVGQGSGIGRRVCR